MHGQPTQNKFEAEVNQESLAAKDLITGHFVGKNGIGFRVICPTSRFYGHLEFPAHLCLDTAEVGICVFAEVKLVLLFRAKRSKARVLDWVPKH
jgi:hypothetical protein